MVNNAIFNTGGGHITVGEYVFFGHNVCVLAGVHEVDKFGLERQRAIPRSGYDIEIGEGAWLATNVMVAGPARIGAHAVVGADPSYARTSNRMQLWQATPRDSSDT